MHKTSKILLDRYFLGLCLKRKFAKQSFLLPDLGEKLANAQVKQYFVTEGQMVKEYDKIAEVATEKATIEISAKNSGKILKLCVKIDDMCDVGAALYEIDVTDESDGQKITAEIDGASQILTPEDVKIDKQKPIDIPRINMEGMIKKSLEEVEVLSTPAVRSFASKLDVNLAFVKGSGPKGRILKEDVLIFHEIIKKEVEKAIQSSSGLSTKSSKHESVQQSNEQTYISKKVVMNMFERGMVKTMSHAATVPHFNLHEEYDISDLFNMRTKLKDSGINISLFALIVKSFSLGLTESPKINSTYFPEKDEFSYQMNTFHNISIAIDGTIGLAAPNIKNVQLLSSEQIDQEIKHLRDLTNTQKLTKEHLNGGTIAMSNVGTISGYLATPLNLPGQCCIVALGKVVTKPVWNEKAAIFEPKKILPVSFGCDHRVLDGATVAKFSRQWRHYIEEPYLIFSKLK